MIRLDRIFDETLYTMKEIEKHIGVKYLSIEKYIKNHKIKHIVLGRKIYVKGNELKKFVLSMNPKPKIKSLKDLINIADSLDKQTKGEEHVRLQQSDNNGEPEGRPPDK